MLAADKKKVEEIATQKSAEAVANLKVEAGEVSREEFDALQAEFNKLSGTLADLKKQLKKVLK